MDNAINTLNGNTQMFGLYAWLYEQEAERTSLRIKMAMQTKAEKGYFRGSNPPYGYRLNKGKFIIRDDETPETVKNIFKMYLDGNGFDAIARKLYNEEIKTPSQVLGKRNQSPLWHGSTIRKILENPPLFYDIKSDFLSVSCLRELVDTSIVSIRGN